MKSRNKLKKKKNLINNKKRKIKLKFNIVVINKKQNQTYIKILLTI